MVETRLCSGQKNFPENLYDMFTDEAVWSYLEKDTNFSLNWHYHKGCYKKKKKEKIVTKKRFEEKRQN